MSLLEEELHAEADESQGAAARSPATLTAFRRGASGVVVPVLTTVIAFIAGGLIVLATGHNPLSTYQSIFNGTGLNWLFPWVSGSERATAASNLQQTLLQATPLILVGLAVAFAFRAGMFNIGGQGQYTVGWIVAVWVGSSFAGMPPLLHIVFAIVAAAAAGAAWAGIAGFLKATTGANEVISTIMLNWIAIWLGVYCFQLGGPLHNPHLSSTPVSNSVVAGAKLPVFWGSSTLQGLDVGIFISLALAVVFGLLIKRTRLGYEARTVGFNPEAASYAGMNVGRTWIRVMLICGAFAGVAASLDILGWKFNLFTNDIQTSHDRLLRDRGGAARPEHGRRHRRRRAAVRGAAHRHLESQHQPEHRSDAGPVPDVHDRGDHHPARLDRRDHAPAAERRAADRRRLQAPAL